MDAPELPEKASGVCEALTSPPAPPSAEVLAMESPPVTGPVPPRLRPPTLKRLWALPARSERAPAFLPPARPLPPAARALMSLAAEPVSPDVELA